MLSYDTNFSSENRNVSDIQGGPKKKRTANVDQILPNLVIS